MKIQAIVLLFAAAVSATSCYDHDEKFLPSKAELPQAGDSNNNWSYCPSKNGCCSNGKVWVSCKSKCAGGASCSISGTSSSC
ncbi:hypothetical protein yc1106_01307 [Curvularia clavata]|uniref:Uncharacterized protein n=1 Tax=Curvularia clavata TaxID=95742 RepID=A0A9Q9DNJ9_CURCL|nr:hypothetical protein yc1106_01307 [Curvularia clavata]